MTDRGTATEAVTRIEREHGDSLFSFARRLGIDDPAADDVVQEALLRLYDELVTGKRIDDHRAWIFTVVYRLAMDEHRRRDRSRRLEVERPPGSDTGDPLDIAERRQVWNAVGRLPERQRAVIYLRYRADLPFEAIARVLGITSSAARSHATQAIASLRRRLSEDPG